MKTLNRIQHTPIESEEKDKNQPNKGKNVFKNDLSFIRVFNKPLKPQKENIQEKLAQKKLDEYKPTILDFILGSSKMEKNWLRYLIKIAINEDQKEFDLKHKNYLIKLEIWKNLQNTTPKNKSKNINIHFSKNKNSTSLLKTSN